MPVTTSKLVENTSFISRTRSKKKLRCSFLLIALASSFGAKADPTQDCVDFGSLFTYPIPGGEDQKLRVAAREASKVNDRAKVERLMLRGLPANEVQGALHPLAMQMQTNVQLIGAAARGDNKVLMALLSQRANPNYVPHLDTLLPALIMASICNRVSTVRLLLDHGADPNVRGVTYTQYRSATNVTALSWAQLLRHRTIATMLIGRGAISGVPEVFHSLDSERPAK